MIRSLIETNPKGFVDRFGDRVAPVLAARVLAHQRHGARIAWLTPSRALSLLLWARCGRAG
ncbi:hypothetical protein ABC977_06270 [Thioalkalicoccus limnaeus]|uniref:Uncharacterized protein n=1 Tax=Thioalkalicoccus limnaeus TaxID=120681 RepID=A0ABV4BCW7_9GAMM